MNTEYKCTKRSICLLHILCYWWRNNVSYTQRLYRPYLWLYLHVNEGNYHCYTEDKYLIKSLREKKKYGAKRLLKMFSNKNWSLGGLKALIKKLTTQVLLLDALGRPTGRPRTVYTVPVSCVQCVVNFFIRAFSPLRLQFLLGNILSNHFAPYFLFSHKDLTK